MTKVESVQGENTAEESSEVNDTDGLGFVVKRLVGRLAWLCKMKQAEWLKVIQKKKKKVASQYTVFPGREGRDFQIGPESTDCWVMC